MCLSSLSLIILCLALTSLKTASWVTEEKMEGKMERNMKKNFKGNNLWGRELYITGPELNLVAWF
jgi:hypothetical protein